MIKSPMTASEINEIKNKVRAEMARRTGYGSLEEYADLTYDFSIIPEQGKRILEEHGQKTSDLLLEITDIPNLDKAIQNRHIPPGFNYQDLNNFVDNLSMEKMESWFLNSPMIRVRSSPKGIGLIKSAILILLSTDIVKYRISAKNPMSNKRCNKLQHHCLSILSQEPMEFWNLPSRLLLW